MQYKKHTTQSGTKRISLASILMIGGVGMSLLVGIGVAQAKINPNPYMQKSPAERSIGAQFVTRDTKDISKALFDCGQGFLQSEPCSENDKANKAPSTDKPDAPAPAKKQAAKGAKLGSALGGEVYDLHHHYLQSEYRLQTRVFATGGWSDVKHVDITLDAPDYVDKPRKLVEHGSTG